jgi:hypothetical protein
MLLGRMRCPEDRRGGRHPGDGDTVDRCASHVSASCRVRCAIRRGSRRVRRIAGCACNQSAQSQVSDDACGARTAAATGRRGPTGSLTGGILAGREARCGQLHWPPRLWGEEATDICQWSSMGSGRRAVNPTASAGSRTSWNAPSTKPPTPSGTPPSERPTPSSPATPHGRHHPRGGEGPERSGTEHLMHV